MSTVTQRSFPEDREPPAAAPAKQSFLRYLGSTFWVKSPTGKSRYIFPGWWMVYISSAQTFFAAPLQTYSFSVYLRVLSQQFGWTPVQVSVLTALNTEEAALEALVMGFLIDRYGPRAVIAVGWAVSALGYLLMPLIYYLNGSVYWMYLCFGMAAFGAGGALYPGMYKAANNWFIKNRGLTIGLTTVGSGFGTPLLVPAVAFMVTQFGWEITMLFAASVFLTMGLPASLLVYEKAIPEDTGLLPDNEQARPAPVAAAAAGQPAAAAQEAPRPAVMKEFGLREALKDRAFWLFTVGGMVFAIGGGSNFTNFQNIRLQELGMSLEVGALYFSLTFIFTQIGRLLATAADFIHPSTAFGLSRIAMGIGIVCFAVASNPLWLLAHAVFYGIGNGYSIPGAGIVIGALFGRQGFGRIRGVSSMITAGVTIVGAILFGFVREWSGTYFLPFAIGGGMFIVGGIITMFARTPKGQIAPGHRAAH